MNGRTLLILAPLLAALAGCTVYPSSGYVAPAPVAVGVSVPLVTPAYGWGYRPWGWGGGWGYRPYGYGGWGYGGWRRW
jgi:hypothetical protein